MPEDTLDDGSNAENPPVENEVMRDIRSMCGIPSGNSDFDDQIRIHANGALSSMWQLGSFSGNVHVLSDDVTSWDMIESDPEVQPLVVEYMCLRTRLSFDPPDMSSLETALTGRLDEVEFRLGIVADNDPVDSKEGFR